MKAEGGDPESSASESAIAIIGFAGRFPGAHSAQAFWENLRDGVESIRRLDDDTLLAAGVARSALDDPGYVKACPVLDDIDKFDAGFFGLSPRDASVMDPAHRIFLEVCWESLEHAGYSALPEDGAVGVFASSGAPLYLMENVRTNPDLMRSMGEFLVRHTGNDMSFLATRVSYAMDLRGPSINVQTACSSALVAVHMACQSLLRSECVIALVGGSTILVPHGQGYVYKEGEILSPDGHCRPFDAKSAGTVFGSGSGCVVLKRLRDALDDGDTIHAVIRGSAINNDGARKVGFLAPGVDGQAAVIESALKAAGVSAESISYIETHGTGTRVGDPIEVEALQEAFRAHTDKRQFCAIGSVKSNIGHLGEAAGVASLIKAVLALKHRQIPPSLGYEAPNPQIEFERSPFFVNDRLRNWEAKGPLRCGITALGAGGTNCHLILEEPPAPLAGDGARAQQLLVLSAKTRTALDRASDNLAQALEQDPAIDLADVAYTLSVGRRPLPFRRVLVASEREEAAAKLRTRDAKQVLTQRVEGAEPSLVFMFPGGGAQYARMGIELYGQEPIYQEAIDACMDVVNPALGRDLRALMFAEVADAEQATRSLEQPSLTLPSIFATEYALAKLLMSWGAQPVAFVGHSMGEYVAACLAGVITLEEALRLVMLRGRLFEAVEAGGMLSVQLSESELRKLMPAGLSIAAVNAPDLCVASGPVTSIQALEEILTTQEVEHTRIRIDVAAHSSMLDPILETFRALCRRIPFRAPQVPFLSNLTGAFITPAQATDPEYWVKHLRSTVRFAECMETLLSTGQRVLLEVGPGRTLSTLARAQRTAAPHTMSSMRHPQEAASDLGFALQAFGRLWLAGVNLDWTALYEGQLRNRIPLPTYPFERQSFWVEPGMQVGRENSKDMAKRLDIGEWFYDLTWRKEPLLQRGALSAKRWLVFSNGSRLARQLIAQLGTDVVVVTPGTAVVEVSAGHWRIDPSSSNQYVEFLQALEEKAQIPEHVIYLWSLSGSERAASFVRPSNGLDDLQAHLRDSFYGPTYLARALGGLSEPVQLSIITSGVAQTGDEWIAPHRAAALGAVLVTPREFAQVRTRCIDVGDTWLRTRELGERILAELRAQSDDRLIALRPGGRWVQKVEALPLPPVAEPSSWLREDGVYLITGGLGGIALELATHMAKQKRVKLALLSRSELPPETEWDRILAEVDGSSRGAQRMVKLRELRALGTEVLVLAADVTSQASLRAALKRVRSELGSITGVIHAAGTMDDEPMHTKTQVAMHHVLAPKIQGTLLLDTLIREDVDFFVLLSSVASFLGLPGQVDYTAANAFLDAFARDRARRGKGRTTVINWNAWRDVGMAELSYRGQTGGIEPSSPCEHPALDGYTDQGEGQREFVTDFSVDRHWLLSEHQIKGSYALLPGSAFVELARAAFSVGRPNAQIELTNLTFISPFQVAKGESRRLRIQLTAAGDAHEITMRSGSDPRSAPHVVGDARVYEGKGPDAVDLAAIRARCTVREEQPKLGLLDQAFVTFGARWGNIARVRYGRNEALIELMLPEQFVTDLKHYHMHPALLDMATGAAQALIPGVDLKSDFYVPLSYARVRLFGPMPAQFVSHVRCLDDSGQGVAHFDITLIGCDGVPFAEISRFSMKRLDGKSALTAAPVAEPRAEQRRNEPMAALLREAITPREGLEAFERIMAQPDLVQAVVSSVDVLQWRAELDAQQYKSASDDSEDAPYGFSRPNMSTEYEAPSTPTEQALAKVWSELLGIRQVGIDDDFFDLGGNSLLAVRLFAAVKKQFRISLPLSTLFAAPNIRALARHLDASVSPHEQTPSSSADGATPAEPRYSSLVAMQASGNRLPFYCAAGMGGNPLNLRALAMLVGMDQPFYGLQPQGLDGYSPLHSTVPEIAAYYVEEIKKKQPKGPYYIGGFSGGGVTAFEMARQLRAAGDEVGALVFLDSIAPVLPSRTRAQRALMHYGRLREQGPAYLVDTVGRRLRSELLDLSRTVRRPLGKLFPYHFRLENIEDTWVDAASSYRPEPYEGDAVLFRAFVRGALTSGTAYEIDELQGWGPLVLGGVEVSACPGEHSTMCEQPHVRVLARRLRGYLDRRMGQREQPRADDESAYA